MARQKKRRSSGFALGMILYVLIFLLLAMLGIKFLDEFLREYEYTRANHVMERFMAGINKDITDQLGREYIETLNSEFTDEEAVSQLIWEKVSHASYAKNMTRSTDEKTVYVLKNGDEVFGNIEFTLGEDVFHGLLANWQFSGGSLELSDCCSEFDITVPEDYAVELNGTEVSEKYITESGIEYDCFKEFYESYELPHLVSYHVDGFFGDVSSVIRDADGRTVELSELTEESYTDNCTAEEKAELDEFINTYISAYMTYTSGANHNSGGNYVVLKQLIVPGSDLLYRVGQAIGGLGFASSHGDELKKITVNRYTNIGDDRYLCDITYDVATIGQDGVHEYPNNTKIVFVRMGGSFLAEAMASY